MSDKKPKFNKKYGEIIWRGRRRRFGLPLSFTRYILTTAKLYESVGFFNISEERVELYRVVDFSLRKPLSQRIFGCGTLIVRAKDKSCPEKKLLSVKNPRMVLRLIEEAVEAERVKYNIHGRDMVGAASSNGSGGSDVE
jgi:hypothetical protein